MKFIFKFYRNFTVNHLFCYLSSLAAAAFTIAMYFINKELNVPVYITIIISAILCIGTAVLVMYKLPYGICRQRVELKKFIPVRILSNVFLTLMINAACSIGFCFIAVMVLGGFLIRLDFVMAHAILKCILFCLFLFILSTLIRQNGDTDTINKVYNPHLIFISHTLSMALLAPFIANDWNMDFYVERDFTTNALTLLREVPFIKSLGAIGFIIGFIILSAYPIT